MESTINTSPDKPMSPAYRREMLKAARDLTDTLIGKAGVLEDSDPDVIAARVTFNALTEAFKYGNASETLSKQDGVQISLALRTLEEVLQFSTQTDTEKRETDNVVPFAREPKQDSSSGIVPGSKTGTFG